MPRKKYEGYEYVDPDNQYTYPNSSVLKNKLGIRDAVEANEHEYEFVLMRLLELEVYPIKIHSMKDILKIHGYIFQDFYDWAGKFRKVNISKQGHAFMAMQSFGTAESYMDSLIKDFHSKAHIREEIIKHLALILDNEN